MRSVFASLFLVLLLQQQLKAQPENPVILFRSEDAGNGGCYRIPALITAADGSLIAAADQRNGSCGDLRWNDDINIVVRRSFDGGHNWSEMATVVDYPAGKSASDPSMILDVTTETIFLFFNFMDHDKGEKNYQLRYICSHDHGSSWSDAVDITDALSPPEWQRHFMLISSGHGIQTRDGMLLHTLVNLEKGLYLFGSKDHGKSWQLITNALLPGDESKVVELHNGNWLVNSRVNGTGKRHTHRTYNEGANWISQAEDALPDPGCNAGLIVYPMEDRQEALLFSNVADSSERQNLTLSISFDGGQSWHTRQSIWQGAAAYSDIAILPDGSLGLVFEKDDYHEIAYVKIRKEILFGQ